MSQPDYSAVLTLVQKEFERSESVSTAFEQSPLLMAIAGKEKKGDKLSEVKVERLMGPDFIIPVRKVSTQTTAAFIPGGSSDTADYQENDPNAEATAYFGYFKSPLRINRIQAREAAGRNAAVPFIKSRTKACLDDASAKIAYDIFRGRGNGARGTLTGVTGSVATELYGLIYQMRDYSGTEYANENSNANNLHFGLQRATQPNFICNVADAGDADDGTGASYVELSNVTLTNASTVISGAASAAYADYRHWRVFYKATTAPSTDYTPIVDPTLQAPRGYVIADTANGAATTLQMSQTFRGTTGTYDVQLRPWFRTDIHGDAGVPTVKKIKRMISGCGGGIDVVLCQPDMLDMLTSSLMDNERYIRNAGVPVLGNQSMAAWGYEYTMIGTAAVFGDAYTPAGEVLGFNTKLMPAKLHKLFDKMQLTDEDFMPLTDGQRVLSDGAVMVTALQVPMVDLSRCFRIIGLTQ